MLKKLTIAVCLFTLTFTGCCPYKMAHGWKTEAPALKEQCSVVGYLAEWSADNINPEWGKYLTEAVFFSIEPNADGTLNLGRFTPERLEKVKALKKQSGIRITMSIGGWGRCEGFAPMATNPETRARFIKALDAYCLEHGFDGVDYDWEFPKNKDEMNGYAALIVETAEALHRYNKTVSVALGVHQRLTPEAYEAMDYLHLMSYDGRERHATQALVERGVDHYVNREGVAPEKLRIGVPFYGRKIEQWDNAKGFKHIAKEFNPDPTADEAGGYYYNGTATLKSKAEWARAQGFDGVMIWELSQDTEDCTLLQALAEGAGFK